MTDGYVKSSGWAVGHLEKLQGMGCTAYNTRFKTINATIYLATAKQKMEDCNHSWFLSSLPVFSVFHLKERKR